MHPHLLSYFHCLGNFDNFFKAFTEKLLQATESASRGSEVEPASSYRKVTGSIPLACMAWHQCMHVWITVGRFGQTRLQNAININLT